MSSEKQSPVAGIEEERDGGVVEFGKGSSAMVVTERRATDCGVKTVANVVINSGESRTTISLSLEDAGKLGELLQKLQHV
jgi:hypothetical protein